MEDNRRMAANFNEEFSAKLPALTLLTNLGYTFIPPAECETLRGNLSGDTNKSTQQVILLPILRQFLAKQTFSFQGKTYPLSEAAIDKVIHQLSPAMNLGLLTANESIYDALMYGVSVTEFIDGKKASPTIKLIDWNTLTENAFHFTEEYVVQTAPATGRRIPDIVCFVNGLPLAVIEAKRPNDAKTGKLTTSAGISQHLRNQGHDEIPHLFAYSQLLLSINGYDGLYGTTGTKEKFWAKWKEELITEAEFSALINKPLAQDKLDLLLNHRPAHVKTEFLSLLNAGELAVTDQDRLLISLLRPDRLLEMSRLFTLFDKKAGKIVARYQQVFGIKALIERISSFDKSGSREGGVIWHTTGSGKSFTMVFLSKALIWL